MLRRIRLPDGQELCYTLTRKAVRNINLRLGPEGDLRASASRSVPVGQIDAFVAQAGPRLLAKRAAAQAVFVVLLAGSFFTLLTVSLSVLVDVVTHNLSSFLLKVTRPC